MKRCPQCGKEYQDTNTLCPADGTVLAKVGDALIGQTLADKYRVEELINEGGMGAVYRGTHVLMDKTVAIKVLHPALAADDKIVARFSREAKAASRISHPHALNVTDFGEDAGGIVFLVMEYLHGKTLKEAIHEDGPMPLPRVVEIIRQVCGALEAAHAGGVVHRDLKSDNIMLVEMGGGDWAKVLDFGIAKITEKVGQDPALTAPNLIIGTPQYMSPEQCSQASEIDARSDIYSLGIIIFEMLAGHVPFTGESPTAIMMKQLQDAPPSILEERKDLPVEVERVIARALAKRPEDRFQTVSELSDNLAQAAEGLAAPAMTNSGVSERDTNRIIVPTDSNEAPRQTANEDYDETTIVRPRTVQALDEPELFRDEVRPPPAQSVNLWKIIIPAAVALVVLFGVIYALTGRNSARPPANDNTLTVDPGGQPVQATSPVTGRGEQGINPNAPVNATSGNTSPGVQPSATPEQNIGEPPVGGNVNENRNVNQSRNDNADNTAVEEPAPSPAKNSNKRGDQLPLPQTSPTPANDTDEPPPPPSPTPKKQQPKPSPPPADAAPKLPQTGNTSSN